MTPFADYMEQILYGPDGYYSSGKAQSGRAGDYFTAPDVGPLFGRLLSEIFHAWQESLQAHPFTLIEAGAGEGRLAADILASRPSRYFAVEKSASRRAQLLKLQARFPSLEVYSDLDAVAPGSIQGVVFGNELLDAFPVHRVRVRNGQLEEAYVENALVWRAPSTPKLQAYFDRLKITLPEGYETEVNLLMADWFSSVAKVLRRGLVLLIDYGRPAQDYYDSERTGGTLRCFKDHRIVDPFARGFRPHENGHVDWTSNVDFTSAALDARAAGFIPLAFMEMGTFLMQGFGLLNRRDNVDLMAHRTALKYLLHPDGMGAAFQVLILGRDIDAGAWTFEHNRLSRLRLSR
jgi:SAM-dependent MidA family methyltransferase